MLFALMGGEFVAYARTKEICDSNILKNRKHSWKFTLKTTTQIEQILIAKISRR